MGEGSCRYTGPREPLTEGVAGVQGEVGGDSSPERDGRQGSNCARPHGSVAWQIAPRPWLCPPRGPGVSETRKVRRGPRTHTLLGGQADTRLGQEEGRVTPNSVPEDALKE